MKFSQRKFSNIVQCPFKIYFWNNTENMVNWENFESSLYMKSLSMPLNIEHSLEHVSTPSASSEDYVLPPDLPREISLQSWTKYRGGGGALPYWKVR